MDICSTFYTGLVLIGLLVFGIPGSGKLQQPFTSLDTSPAPSSAHSPHCTAQRAPTPLTETLLFSSQQAMLSLMTLFSVAAGYLLTFFSRMDALLLQLGRASTWAGSHLDRAPPILLPCLSGDGHPRTS